MINKLQKHPSVTAFGAGWLAVAALPPYYVWPVLFLSFPILIWLIDRAQGFGQAFRRGYSFGFAYFAFGLLWVNNALLLDARLFGWLVPITFLAAGVFFGLFVAFPAALSHCFKTLPARYLSFAALWVIFEWLRSFVLTGFPWNLLGSVLTFSDSLIQTASLGGTYLLSLLLLLAAAAPIFLFSARRPWNMAVGLGLPVLIFALSEGWGYWRLQNYPYAPSDITIRLVQPAIPQTLKWNRAMLEDNLAAHIKMSQLPEQDKANVVIWSETAFPYALEFDDYHRDMLRYAVPPKGWLITGGIGHNEYEDGRYDSSNSLFVVDDHGQIAARYDKSHLVPFGEYVPLREWLPRWIRPVANAVGTFKAGDGPKVITVDGLPAFGGLVCYEIIFPAEIVDSQNRPQWLVNITNDGWYGDSAGPHQHLAATRLRAVEEGLAIARVSGTGISALISPTGVVIGQIPLNQKGILDLKLPKLSSIPALYAQTGNSLILGLCIFLLLLAALSPFFKKK